MPRPTQQPIAAKQAPINYTLDMPGGFYAPTGDRIERMEDADAVRMMAEASRRDVADYRDPACLQKAA